MRSTPAGIVACIAIVLAMTGVAQAVGLLRQNLLFTRVQTEVSFWGRGEYQPTENSINRTIKQLDELLMQGPTHPDYLSLQASVSAWLAYWSEQGTVRKQSATAGEGYARQAISSQYAALISRPAHRYSWENLAQYLSRSADYYPATQSNITLAALTRMRLNGLAPKATP